MAARTIIPATRSPLDVAFWLLERAVSERQAPDLRRLRLLLYLAQAHYAGERSGAKLMPATFVAETDGPIEPTVALVLESGLHDPWSPQLAEPVDEFLQRLWRRYGALPAVALQRLIGADRIWTAALAAGVGTEITVDAMQQAYLDRPKTTRPIKKEAAPSAEERPQPELEPNPDIRFTADGRAVTRWKPKRRIDKPDG